jgi:hypothetical protein
MNVKVSFDARTSVWDAVLTCRKVPVPPNMVSIRDFWLAVLDSVTWKQLLHIFGQVDGFLYYSVRHQRHTYGWTQVMPVSLARKVAYWDSRCWKYTKVCATQRLQILSKQQQLITNRCPVSDWTYSNSRPRMCWTTNMGQVLTAVKTTMLFVFLMWSWLILTQRVKTFPERSLLCSQEFATRPCLEPD